MRRFLIFVGGLAACGLVYGWLGPLHRSTDTVGMLRPVLGLVVLLAAWAARGPVLRLTFVSLGGLTLISVALFVLPQRPGDDLRLYSRNLWFGNDRIDAVAADIRATAPDVVMLQEVSGANAALITELQDDFPHQHVCQFSQWSAMALLSKHPFATAPLCSDHRALAAAQIDLNGRAVWVVSTHIPWPWPFDNAGAERSAETLLRTLTGPIVLAGDFNTFPWSGRLQRIRRITGTRLAGPTRPTLTYRHVPLPLDHVLAPGGGAVRLRPLLGGDHRGLVADVTL